MYKKEGFENGTLFERDAEIYHKLINYENQEVIHMLLTLSMLTLSWQIALLT